MWYRGANSFLPGSSPIIVLTHLDTQKDPQQLNQRIQEFEQLNCPRVYKVANYTRTQNEPNKKTDANMIEVLFNSCLVGDQVIQNLLKKTNKSCCCNWSNFYCGLWWWFWPLATLDQYIPRQTLHTSRQNCWSWKLKKKNVLHFVKFVNALFLKKIRNTNLNYIKFVQLFARLFVFNSL